VRPARPATSPKPHVINIPDPLFTRARSNPGCCKPAYGGAHETGPAPHEGREVVAMQISASRGDQAGAPFVAHQGEEFPTARTSIGALGDTGYVAKGTERSPNGGHQPVSPSLCGYVRSSGSPESASSSRFEACATSKQPTRWAPRKNAYVQSAPTSRQWPSRNLQGVILSQRSRRLR
jgi:hypothetical protein